MKQLIVSACSEKVMYLFRPKENGNRKQERFVPFVLQVDRYMIVSLQALTVCCVMPGGTPWQSRLPSTPFKQEEEIYMC